MFVLNIFKYDLIDIDFFFCPKNIKIYFWTLNTKQFFYLPSFFFFNLINVLKFKFLSKFYFKTFISNLLRLYHYGFMFNFIRLRIRGLGYYITEITSNILSFFFNRINFIYLFSPLAIFIKVYKKRIILLSKNKCMLKSILYYILKLKKLGPYRMLGFKIPKFFMLLHKSKKKV